MPFGENRDAGELRTRHKRGDALLVEKRRDQPDLARDLTPM